MSCRKQPFGRGLKMAACISRCSIRASPIRDSRSCHGSLFSTSMLLLLWLASAVTPEDSSPLFFAGFFCSTGFTKSLTGMFWAPCERAGGRLSQRMRVQRFRQRLTF